MKGRSQRLPAPAHADDWGDGSWTVDCPCGVTYDDGEEMVKCDECGVWVHTRCSRFVKEEASFACGKCRGDGGAASLMEETEVAQLLAELPTKADPCPPPAAPPRAGIRRWAERPMEEKVHVQGVPGGDPTLFAGGISAVFSGELWKCTGYVPKKFNFKYREFPCWDLDEAENPASAGADLLVSLSAGVVTEAVERLESPLVTRSGDGCGLFSGSGHSFTKKERSRFRGLGLHSGKRREVSSAGSKDRPVKKIKISASSEKSGGAKHAGSVPRVDASKSGLIDKGITRRLNIELEKMRCEDKKVEEFSVPSNDARLEGEGTKDDMKNALPVKIPAKDSASAASEHKSLPQALAKEDHVKLNGPVCNGNLLKTDDLAKSTGPASLMAEVSTKEDAGDIKPDRSSNACSAVRNLKHASVRFDAESWQLKHTIKDFGSASQVLLDTCNKSSKRHLESKCKEETVSDAGQADEGKKKPAPSVGRLEDQSLLGDLVQRQSLSLPINLPSYEMRPMPEKDACVLQVDVKEPAIHPVSEQTAVITSGRSESEKLGPEQEKIGGQSPGIASGPSESVALGPEHEPMGEQSAGVVSGPSESKKFCTQQEVTGGHDKTVETCRSQSSTREHAKPGSAITDHVAREHAKPGSAITDHVAREHTLVVAVGKLPSTANVPDKLKPPNPDSYRSPDTTSSSTAPRTVPFTKRAKVNSGSINKKNSVGTGVSADGNLHGEELFQSKGSAISVDSLLVKKNGHASSYKHKSVELKENGSCPSKTSSAENSTSSSGSGRLGGPPRNQSTSLLVKLAQSDSGTRNIRKTSPSYQASSRMVNHSTTMHRPIPPSVVNTSSTLSDEELAKRLHHELNSSPRVSRVPRGLHASGIHLASMTSASMLSKRSSSSNSGGRHQGLVSRRRNKEDTCKDAIRSCEPSDKVEDLELPFTPHEKLSESLHVSESIKKDAHKGLHNVAPPANETSHLAPIAVDGSGPPFRTLPGLIDEITQDGRHMTYEELCDAVLPHWSSLRKPNGEQYGYSSHSLAVLDCLRNRNEWAHLVDYEPKTYSSKKRSNAHTTRSTEGSENGKAEGSAGRKDRSEDSRPPTKGKRLARKRRKLMLRGRAVQVSKGRKIDDDSDDDIGSLSGEEGSQSFSSKEEIRGSRRRNSSGGISVSSPEESD